MSKKVLLLTGQAKSKEIEDPIGAFNASLVEAFELQQEGELDLVIWSTWTDDAEQFSANNSLNHPQEFRYEVTAQPPLGDNGQGNIKAQMATFKAGVELAQRSAGDDCLILKTRPDGHIKKEFIKTIFSLDYSLNSSSEILHSKVWVPWFNMLKPFYLEDSFFAAPAPTMHQLHNIDEMFTYPNIGQGLSHVRRFIYPFLNQHPILKKYIANHYGATRELQRSYSFEGIQGETLDYFTELFGTYYYLLQRFFLVKEEAGSITHYCWHKMPTERRFQDSLSFTYNNHPSSGDSGGLIYIYDMNWLGKLLQGEFNHDEFSYGIFKKAKALENGHK